MRGESVQLEASGGDRYLWSPSTGLNNPEISNPLASPVSTITYTVTAYDSLGCISEQEVKIIVTSEAFIPTLFTPNNDGKNDALKIFGLGSVTKFNFKIYNRSGSMVYQSSNVIEVSQRGWNGRWKNKELPNGVYYWKVSGTYQDGDAVNLNGKPSGAIHLLR